jgi:hypothetical protein
MTFTVEQKSQLAKLLATENLTIEHKKIPTASFDPKNRVLNCPIWQDMSGSLYDLLMGHEVGHALFTPAQGWHDAASSMGPKFKGFLNVVEDARIEKKIQRKYPGLKYSFIKGYQSLIDRNLFGTKDRDLNSMSFIDRLNIHIKVGNLLPIEFNNQDEIDLLNRVKACETWEDVLDVTKAVFDYSKNEQFETMEKMLQSSQIEAGDGDEEFETEESFGDDYEDEEGEQSVGEKRNSSSEEGEEADDESGKQTKSENKGDDGDAGEDEEENGKSVNRFKDSQVSQKDQYNAEDFEPTCETDEAFRANETGLVDEQCKPYVYVKIPKVNLENIITPAKIVQDALKTYYFDGNQAGKDMAEKLVAEFKTKNDSYIGLLAKEFEMKKAARAYSKAKTATTGDIDINKLYKYQVDDNIFKKMMRVPKGKSHGLVLLLDRSGSMSSNMSASIEQILVLSAFCRRVNIPFVVYGFSDSDEGRYADFKVKAGESFTSGENDLELTNVYLREYLNSRMNNLEYNSCVRNMLMLKKSYEARFIGRPVNESLGNTPLIQAMVALEPITKQFRKLNNLDMVNLVVVHDGDADRVNTYMQYREPRDWESQTEKVLGYARFSISEHNVFLRDNDSKMQVKINQNKHDYYDHDDGMRLSIFDWYTAKTGAKIFGFFIAGEGRRIRQSIASKYINKDGKSVYKTVRESLPHANSYYAFDKSEYVKSLCSEIRDKKFIQSYNKGYESFFIMPGGTDLAIEADEELVVTGTFTANKLKNAFLKMNKKKQVSRVMVSRFIEGIAV